MKGVIQGKSNKSNGSGGSGGLNVFAQLAEPSTKDGVWIKTEAKYGETYTQLTDIPYQFYLGSAVAIGTDVYLFGGGSSDRKYAYKYSYKSIADANIFIETFNLYYTLLVNKLKIDISNAKISDGTQLLDYPCYYGNGTEWIEI